jgi:hypothetical protein
MAKEPETPLAVTRQSPGVWSAVALGVNLVTTWALFNSIIWAAVWQMRPWTIALHLLVVVPAEWVSWRSLLEARRSGSVPARVASLLAVAWAVALAIGAIVIIAVHHPGLM